MSNPGRPLHPLLTCRGEPMWRGCYLKRLHVNEQACLWVGSQGTAQEWGFPLHPFVAAALLQVLWPRLTPFESTSSWGECFPHDADLSVNHTWVWKLTVFSNHWSKTMEVREGQKRERERKQEHTVFICLFIWKKKKEKKATLAPPSDSQFFPMPKPSHFSLATR